MSDGLRPKGARDTGEVSAETEGRSNDVLKGGSSPALCARWDRTGKGHGRGGGNIRKDNYGEQISKMIVWRSEALRIRTLSMAILR
jgi:hypothetical protein